MESKEKSRDLNTKKESYVVSDRDREEIEKDIKDKEINKASPGTKEKIINITEKVLAYGLPTFIAVGGVTGIIVAGETGNLPKDIKGWDAQKAYEDIVSDFRGVFGIEEANEEMTKIEEDLLDGKRGIKRGAVDTEELHGNQEIKPVIPITPIEKKEKMTPITQIPPKKK